MSATTPPTEHAPLTAETADLARQLDALPADHRSVLLAVIRFEVIRMRMRRGRVERTAKRA